MLQVCSTGLRTTYSLRPNSNLFIFVTASCDGWYTTYYTDVNCTDVYKTTQMDDYTSCRPAESLQVSNLLSVRGKCTFSPNLPILSDSYIVRYRVYYL